MIKVKKQAYRFGIVLLAAVMIIASLQWFAPSYVLGENEGVEINLSNLSVTPSTASAQQEVRVKFDFRVTLNASGVAYFKEGDCIDIRTNFKYMFDSDQSFAVPVRDHGGNQLGELNYNAGNGKVSFTVSEAAGNMEFHTLIGSFDSFKHFKAKNVETDKTYTATAGIGLTAPVTVPFEIKALQRQLSIQSSGKGSLSGVTGTVTLNERDEVEVIATPNDSGDPADPNQVLSATLIRSDNTREAFTTPTLPTSNTATYRIKYSDLKPGLNTFVVAFSSDEEQNNDEGFYPGEKNTSIYKRIYNRDWSTYVSGVPVIYSDGAMGMSANNDIYVNTKGITQLYESSGQETNVLSNLIVEDTLPGGPVGTIHTGRGLRIYAVMPYWFTGTDGKVKAIHPESGTHIGYRPGGAAGNTELTASGLLEKIEQHAGEKLDQFRSRVSARPLSYGIFVDPSTRETTWIANFGSPGNKNGPALKCSELWPVALARDSKLNELNGDGNCVGGNVQYFRITYYCDHNNVKYTSVFTNTAKLNSAELNQESSVPYAVKCDNSQGEGHKSTLTVHVVDALDQSHDIAGVDVKLEKWNDGGGAWEDATHEGRTIEGVTGDDGELVLGESDGSVETGTLTPGRYRIREVSLPEHYSAGTMVVTAAPSSQGPISADGEFTVAATDTKGFVALVTFSKAYDVNYHANGGQGELKCPNNPHPSGTKATVLAPGEAITRADHYFVGWNTDADGNGDWYAPGDEVDIIDQDVNLYAQWKLNAKATTMLTGSKVWDDLDNASGKRPAIDANQGQPVDLELVNLNGYEFPEGAEPPKPLWKQNEEDPNRWDYLYANLPRYDADRNLITWCVVEKPSKDYEVSYENTNEWNYLTDRAYSGGVIKNTLNNVTLTYKLNGGSYKGSSADIKISEKPGAKIKIHDAPKREGYTFQYWKGSKYNPGQEYQVSEDHTFTAVWKKDDSPSSDDKDESDDQNKLDNKYDKKGTSDNNKTDVKKLSGKNNKSKAVKTGDEVNLTLLVVDFITAMCLLVILLFRRRRMV